MRIDLFLKVTGLVKTRMAAKHLCDTQKALLDGQPVKPSHEVQAGQEWSLFFPLREVRVKVLQIPKPKSVPKRDRPDYVQVEDLGER